MTHKHELEFMVGTKDIICMYDACDFRVDRDTILQIIDLLSQGLSWDGNQTISVQDMINQLDKLEVFGWTCATDC